MMGVTWLCIALCVSAVCVSADRGGSSLRGALEALQRRQRSRIHRPIIPQPDYDSLYEFVPPQAYPEPDYSIDIEDPDEDPNGKYVVKFLDDNDTPPEAYEYKLIKKKSSHPNSVNPSKQESAFRERSHSSDRLKDLFLDKNEGSEHKKEPQINDKDAEYAVLLGHLWSKYRFNKEHGNEESAPRGVVKLYKEKVVKKRYPDNWGPIAFKRKRSSSPESDHPFIAEYEERKNDLGPQEISYSPYEISDDDKDDMREEYAIAFQPLDDDTISDPSDDDQYTLDTVEKRFPVSKRSSGPYEFEPKKKLQNQNKREALKGFRSASGTDPKIIRDLSKIFGDSEYELIKSPVKRSSDHADEEHEAKPPMLPMSHNHTQERVNATVEEDDSHEHHGHNIHHPGVSGKEVETEHGDNHQHEHTHVHDHNHDKKLSEKPIIVKKKSVDWSDYFGIDKRKHPVSFIEDLNQDRLRKQYFDTFNKEVIYPLNSFRRHNFAKRNFVKSKPKDEAEVNMDRKQGVPVPNDNKRNSADDSDSKLDSIDKKLKSMEGLIVDEALHYSNIGEELDSKEEQEMKEKLLSRLAAAYSLEKMRKALKEFKQSLQTTRGPANVDTSNIPVEEAKAKRVAVKKELLNNEIPISNKIDDSIDFEDEQGAGHYLNGKGEEHFSEGYMGGSGRHRIPVMSTAAAAGSCPVLTKIVQRCRNVDFLAGDRGQLFLPLCSLHQICYLCGEAPPTTCDLVFLSEADTTCESDMSCQRAARTALMALRELHDNLADEMDGECETNPCLTSTLKLNEGWQRALQR